MSEAEASYQRQVERDLPRNFVIQLCHGLLGQTGFRLINTPTFVPAYILLLSQGSDLAVGLALALQSLGSALTPLISASIIGHRQRIIPVAFITGGAMRLSVLALALCGLLLSGPWALWGAMLSLGLFGVFAGMQTVVFQVLLAKVIPVANRGKLMGLRNFLAGITTALVAWIGGTYLLGDPPDAIGYGWIFLVAFVLTTCGLLLLALLREPRPPTVAPRRSLLSQLAGLPTFLREEPAFARYVVARAMATLGRMALPFYILYAGQQVGLSGSILATLTVSYTIAATVSNLGWGVIADRSGFRLCFLLSIGLWIAATLGLMASGSALPALILVFALLGGSQEGFRLAAFAMVMEFGRRENMPLRVAVANSSSEATGALAPLVGGALAAGLGYPWVFWISCIFLVAGGLLTLFTVPEPRTARSA